MRMITFAIPLWFLLGNTAPAQHKVPSLLFDAAHCLALKQFLPLPDSRQITLGYILDERSYPGKKVVYVVVYTAPSQSSGWIFALFLNTNVSGKTFNIQNNARFTLSKTEPIGVSFTTPPLGGTWTQEHLALAIKEIEKKPRFTIGVKDLSAANPCKCESYTDPQPKVN